MVYPFFKRALDVVCGIGAIFILLPLAAAIALGIRVVHGRPVFFSQLRPGRQERPFRILKFRTLEKAPERQKPGQETLMPTRWGAILRRLSLDEIPQLINVVRGDMSFVGPRPLLIEYLPLYDERQRTRHAVRPGMTGLAQVRGRNFLSWEDRLEMDVEYVQKMSLALDLRILLRTLKVVFSRVGVAEYGSEEDSRFDD